MKVKDTLMSVLNKIDRTNKNRNLVILKKVHEIIGAIKLDVETKDEKSFCESIIPFLKMLPDRKYNLQNEFTPSFTSVWEKEDGKLVYKFITIINDYFLRYTITIDIVNMTIETKYNSNEWINDISLHKEFIRFGYVDFTEFVRESLLHDLKTNVFIDLSKDKIRLIDIKPKESHGDFLKGTKIKNQTDITVTKVDSLWNVTTIGVGEFKVRGHFKLQVCGVGFSERKLIYIDEYVKTHYIRRSTRDIVFGS